MTQEELKAIQKQLRDLVARNRLGDAINELLKLAEKPGFQHLLIGANLQSTRFASLNEKRRKGVLSSEQENLLHNQVAEILLEMVDQVGGSRQNPSTTQGSVGNHQTVDGNGNIVIVGTNNSHISINTDRGNSSPAPTAPESKKPSKLWKWILGISVIAGILGGIAEFTGFLQNNMSGSKIEEPFGIKILVHGSKGKSDLILRDRGKVYLELPGERREAPINNLGIAGFSDLSPKYLGKLIRLIVLDDDNGKILNLDVEHPLKADSMYYIEVKLPEKGSFIGPLAGTAKKEGLNKKPIEPGAANFSGQIVDDKGQGLKGVKVFIPGVEATVTDEAGRFSTVCPMDRQKQDLEIEVSVQHQGFRPYSNRYKLPMANAYIQLTKNDTEH